MDTMGLSQNKIIFWSLCAVLVATIAVTHFTQLSTVPRGINIDEVGMAYDAWSISKTGHDSYMNTWPIYFLNRGDGMSALYVYLEAIIIAVFGVSVVGMRIPAVLASFVTLFAGAYIVRAQWPRRRLPLLLYLFLFAVAPYYTIYSRIALDCNMLLPLSTLLIATIIFNLRRKKPLWWISGIVAGITLYTYVLSWIIVPFFLLALTVWLLWRHRFSWRQVAALWFPLCMMALPLVGVVAVNFFSVAPFTIGPVTVPRLINVRGGDLGFSLRNITYLFDSLLLGDDIYKYVNPRYTPLQYLSLPFVFVGFAFCVYRTYRAWLSKRLHTAIVLFLWFVSYFLLALFLSGEGKQGPVIHQLNGLFFVTLFFILWGIVGSFDQLKSWLSHNKRFSQAPSFLLSTLVVAYAIFFGFFCRDYFVLQPRSWDQGETDKNISSAFGSLSSDFPSLGDAIAYVKSLPPALRDRTTYIRHVQFPEVYFLLSQRIPASEIYQERSVDGRVWGYKNYVFKKPEQYVLTENYIVANWQGPELTQLKSMGFNSVKRFGKYWVFTNP